MSRIHVSTLGRLVIRDEDRELAQLPAQRLRCALLVYLAVERRATREQILSLLWPDRDPDRARHSLSQTLYELRTTLDGDWVESRGDLMVVHDDVTADVVEFEDAVENGGWSRAVEIYRGRFLDGIYLVDTREFEGWVDRLRGRTGRLFRQALGEAVGESRAAGDLEEALRLARRGVELDPLDDESQHQLVLLLAESGRRSAALKQYERYERLLRDELDVEPLDQTIELVRRIRKGRLDESGGALLGEPQVEGTEAVGRAPQGAAEDDAPPDLIPARGRGSFLGQRTRSGSQARLPSLLQRSTFVAIGVGIFVAVLMGFLWFGRSTEDATAVSRVGPSFPSSRIAVLYFDDHSADGGLGARADGMTEALINELAQVPGLDVVSRNGARLFRQRGVVPWDSMVSVLEVGTVVEGSLNRAGDTARVTVQLVDAATRRSVESTVIELPTEDWFVIQDSVGAEVASMVQERVGLDVRLNELRAGADIAEALQLVQNAEFERKTAGALRAEGALADAESALMRADSLLSIASQLDDDWVRPPLLRGWVALERAALEEARMFESGGEGESPAPYLRRAREHARSALDMDPESAEALELAGVALAETWPSGLAGDSTGLMIQWAERDLRAAIGFDPSLTRARGALAMLLLQTGRAEEAYIHAREALDRDRFLGNLDDVLFVLGQTSLDLMRPDEAAEWFAQGRRRFPRDPRFPAGELALLAYSELWRPDPDRAWTLHREVERLTAPHLRRTNAAYNQMYVSAVLARGGRSDSALAVARRLEREGFPTGARIGVLNLEAYVWMLLGQEDSAIAHLEAYLEAAPQQRSQLANDWLFEPLRDNPRFRQLVER